MAKQVNNGRTFRVVDFAGNVLENASELPQDIRDLADDLNQELIDIARGVDAEKQRTKAQVEENLKQGAIERYWAKSLDWLQDPGNLLISFIAFVAFVLLIRKW